MPQSYEFAAAAFAWLIAPTGVVVSSILLWQNILKLREAQLKIRQLKEELAESRRLRDQLIRIPSDEVMREILREHLTFKLQALEQPATRERLAAAPRRALVTSLFLMVICSVPLLVLITSRPSVTPLAAAQERRLEAVTQEIQDLRARQGEVELELVRKSSRVDDLTAILLGDANPHKLK